jgi:pyridoxamine 5'-phosphate oxidase
MLFSIHNTLAEIFLQVKNELEKGASDPNHPFRFVSLATHLKREIELRYVVFRKLDKDLNFYFFTDSRSGKVTHLLNNSEIALLFYHQRERVQIRVKGFAKIHQQDDLTSRLWSELPGESQKSYNSELSPGSLIGSPEMAYQWKEEMDSAFFAVLKVEPVSIEALQLNGLEHIRISFLKKEEDWQMSWLAP